MKQQFGTEKQQCGSEKQQFPDREARGMETDLNQRERRRYAGRLRELAELAGKAADALEAEDDTKAMARVLVLAMSGDSVMELVDTLDIASQHASHENSAFPRVGALELAASGPPPRRRP